MNGKFRRYALAVTIACALLYLSGCTGGTETKIDFLAADGTHEEAKALFKKNCVSCHGTDLSGRVGGQSDLRQVSSRLSAERIEQIVSEGQGRMPAFGDKLSEEDISALVAWLGELK